MKMLIFSNIDAGDGDLACAGLGQYLAFNILDVIHVYPCLSDSPNGGPICIAAWAWVGFDALRMELALDTASLADLQNGARKWPSSVCKSSCRIGPSPKTVRHYPIASRSPLHFGSLI